MAKEVRQFNRLYGVTITNNWGTYFRGSISSTINPDLGFKIQFSSAAAWTALFGFETEEECREFIDRCHLDECYDFRISRIRAEGKDWVKVPIWYDDENLNISEVAWVDNDKFTTYRSSQRFVNQAKEAFPQYLDPDAPGPHGGFSLWEDFDPNTQEIVNTPEHEINSDGRTYTLYVLENSDHSSFLCGDSFSEYSGGRINIGPSETSQDPQIFFDSELSAQFENAWYEDYNWRAKRVTVTEPLLSCKTLRNNQKVFFRKADIDQIIQNSKSEAIQKAIHSPYFEVKDKQKGFSLWENFDPNNQEIVNTPEYTVAPGPHTLYTVEDADGSEFLSVDKFGPGARGRFYLIRSNQIVFAGIRREELAQIYFESREDARESFDLFYDHVEGFSIKEVTISDPLIYGVVNHSGRPCYIKKADFKYVIARSHPDEIHAASYRDWFMLKEKRKGFSRWG